MLNPKCSFGDVILPCAANGVARARARSGTAKCASRVEPDQRVERVAVMTSNLWGDGTERNYDGKQAYAVGRQTVRRSRPQVSGHRPQSEDAGVIGTCGL